MMTTGFKKTMKWLPMVLAVAAGDTLLHAQTERAIERRMERNQRQMQRQANRSDYYPAGTWQQLNPWIQQSGVVPYTNSTPARPAATAAGAVGNAVRQTVDAATRIGDRQFGYRDQSPQSTWFYDYYTIYPTYYVPQGDDRYASAVRYFDSDGDGVFESQSSYRDSDSDGSYDEYDRLDFYAVPESSTTNVQSTTATETTQQTTAYVGPQDARRHQVSGEIGMTKVAQVNNQEHLVVALKNQDAQQFAIDLGPADRLQANNIEVGTQLTATGPLQTIGDKQVMIAESVQIAGGQSITIDRSFGQSYRGEVVDVKTMKIDNTDYYMAVVNVDGERQLVDLGPITSYKVELKPATQITFQGVPVRASDHRVLLAQQVQLGGNEVVRIERTRKF